MVHPKSLAALSFFAASLLAQPPQFNRDIRPILSDRCLSCHGQDAANKGIRLRLDKEEFAKGDLGGGRRAIVPGNPESSLMLQRIQSPNRALRMPPAHTGTTVSSQELALLDGWIRAGAEWQKHWSFLPPQKSAVPPGRNAIDYFVQERLEKVGLSPSPAADRRTLLRRVSLDLTGLPPTPEEAQEFLADMSSDAWGRVVNRLLASPRYAERMAIRWLDASRYADTNGYQTDADRIMWRWRDWVLDAFRRNMPFDQFTREQIAGDLLPGATTAQRIATGFSRNHRGNSEGGIVPEEYLLEYAADRVETMSTVFLGLTVGCARCHNHKYDPITQKEYYQLIAYFNNIGEPGRYLKYGNSPPMVAAPTPAQEAKLRSLRDQAEAVKRGFDELEPVTAAAQAQWEKKLQPGLQWWPSEQMTAELFQKPLVFTADKPVDAGASAEFGFQDRFTLAFRIKTSSGNGTILHRMADDEASPTGYGLHLENGKIQAHFAVRRLDDAILLESQRTLEKDRWHHIAITYDGSRYASGIQLFVDGEPWQWTVQLDALNQDFRKSGSLILGAGGGWPDAFRGELSSFRAYSRVLSAADVAMLAVPESLDQIARIPLPRRTAAQRENLRQAYYELGASREMRAARTARFAKAAELEAFEQTIPTVMVMRERPEATPTFVLQRGAYDRPGEKVGRGVPAILSTTSAPDRLTLANWLVDRSNPLTARVMVNRVWQMAFGVGLVKTTEDFGAQGDWPSHPELLDWLAVDFMENGWDLHHLWKTILQSRTYQQSSSVTAELREKDPENRLLARGPRFRLPAEMVRDQALFASGLLVETIGGPSVKPYQPAGLWSENGGADYKRDNGDGLYRRSLYTFWRRTSPPPFMATFDSALRESCSVREGRTNTPLQALHLMNDVQFLEAARVLAQRSLREGGAGKEERMRRMFALVLGRDPREAEIRSLHAMLIYASDRFRSQPEAALSYLHQGDAPLVETESPADLAAWSTVASMILNLDAAVTKE